MKIKSIKVYQAALYNKKSHLSFRTDGKGTLDEPVQLDAVPGVGVRIEGKSDIILVPYPNIAFMGLERDEEEKPKTTKTKGA